MFRNFQLTLTPECGEFVKKEYKKAKLIVEYGSGGSTFLAAALSGKKVLSVESDIKWLMELMSAYKEQDLKGDIVPLWADIGETKEFGYPADESKYKDWPNYAKLPFLFCREHKLSPDLALIDGRFRVACFLACCAYTKTNMKILFDDYAVRKRYHVVERICKPSAIIGDRMAVFDIKPKMVNSDFLADHYHYFYRPQ
ncbi:hypothetical protein PN836_019545 [Ningiella sp. W23]|uniref:hypothetical protein n=1 Tax=Ningiella sp. W23 TaxID=3023715 RepID=UPI003756405D